MLKMSTKGRYGLRAMIDLAEAYNEDHTPVMMGEIAKRQDFSRKYLHALLTSLKQAGLVQATRGAKGGYHLSRWGADETGMRGSPFSIIYPHHGTIGAH